MAKNPELVMFYNVENLFPPDTDIRDRHNPAFSGLKRWNTDRYKHKIKNISQVFYWVEERYSSLPFLIGLCEIQGRKPLQDLITESPLNGRYEAVHYDSLDERGVDVALLYDRTKVEVLHSEPFRYFFKIGNTENLDTTRDVLYCRLKYLGNPLNVFVLHLPSKRENDINKPKREHILKDIKKRAEKIINETNEPVLLMGDFNVIMAMKDCFSIRFMRSIKTANILLFIRKMACCLTRFCSLLIC
ncbi:MAG: hypothetical protein Q4C75_05250 [Bergeyella zoohelcum]|nr:hypothetical protein [Bergeyella zoohelcum]